MLFRSENATVSDSRQFFLRIAIASGIVIALGIWPLMRNAEGGSTVIGAAIVGFALSLANVLGAFAGIVMARKRGGQEFNIIVFGSMTIRMLLMMALIYLMVAFVKLPVIAFVASLFAFYVVFLIIEVHYLWSSSRRS